MKRTYSQIDLDERRKIARWRHASVAVDLIAERLGRHRSTIFREIARNKFEDREMPDLTGYFCVVANSKAEDRRSHHRKLVRHPTLRASIIERIKHGWSPVQIAGRLAYERNSVRVSHETIYRFAYLSDGYEMKLWRYLPESCARRRPRHARRRHGRRFSPELSILHRPDFVRERNQLGQWECDLIQFRKKCGKELRLRNISTIEAANAYASEFIIDFNARFGKEPRNPKDMHRPLADHESLDGAMCRKEVRTPSQALTLRYDKVLFILEPSDHAKRLSGKKVIVCDYPDGRLEIMYDGVTLPYRTFDKLRSVNRAEIVGNKRLDAALAMVAEMQAGRELKRSQQGPRRTGQANHMFGVPDGSESNGYQKRGRKPGRKTDFVNDPAVIVRREQALARLAAAE